MSDPRPVTVFLAFANDRSGARYLRNLPEEQRHVRAALETAVEAGLCEVVERSNATVDEVLDVFQHSDYRDRIAVFHFGGHAGSAALLMESASGAVAVAHAGGLARFLGTQRGLELVFLNGCSSHGQVQGFLDAGVRAVIATSEAIDDGVAMEFAGRFYKALASGATIRTAYTEAQGAVQTRQGEQARGTYRSFVPDEVVAERWPWDLYVAPGAEERLVRWSLPLAARDPLFGLPPLPLLDLPAAPFKHLSWFGRQDAPVFFGRGREIRDLYEAVTRLDGEPIVLLFGATGAGKSSLLAAGLAPRLEATHEVVYLRRDAGRGVAGTLAQVLDAHGTPADLGAAWRAREQATGKPLVVILDQVEEAWTHPQTGGAEAEELASALRSMFGIREKRPRGRLILGFRKEWLAEMLRLVDGPSLPRVRVEVAPLDRDGIAEAVAGPARSESLRRHYGLEVEPELPGIIADDLLEDSGAAIAPALQILLTKMWTLATQENPAAPRFTVELYRRLKRGGILLDDFLGEQLASLRQWRPDLVDSGLVLDLLGHHTTALGTAETRKAAEVVARYGGRPEIAGLLRQCQDRYLLACTGDDTRLAHDTLAPLVRRRFELSDLPGQRALRILQQRAVEWAEGKEGAPLDEVDLTMIEQGAGGMRAWTADEERLVARSRVEKARRQRRRRVLQTAAVLAVAVVTTAGAAAWWQWSRAENERSKAEAVTSFLTNMYQDLDPLRAGLDANTLPRILDRAQGKIDTDLKGKAELQDRLREAIGVVNLNLGRLKNAESLLEPVVAFRRQELGENHPDTLDAKTQLANVYANQARRKEAEALYRQVLESHLAGPGQDAPETLQAMSNLSTIYRDQGRWKEAEQLTDQVLAGLRRLGRADGDPDLLKAMTNQANLYTLQGRLAEAEKLSGRVLELRRAAGPERPDTLAAMTVHANIIADLGRLKQAEELDRQALAISRRILGPEHPNTLMYKQNLANVLYEQNRLPEAEALSRELLVSYQKNLGPSHPDTIAVMSNLAAMVGDQGRLQEAETLLRSAHDSSLRRWGPDHPDSLKIAGNLAAIYHEKGRSEEAEHLLRETLVRMRRVLGPENPSTVQVMHNLGVICQSRGLLSEAESLLRPAVAAFRKTLGDESSYTQSALMHLAAVYQAQGRRDKADELLHPSPTRKPD